jgi:hypothetical protein
MQLAPAARGVVALSGAESAAVGGGEDICVAVPTLTGPAVVICGSVRLVKIVISILS